MKKYKKFFLILSLVFIFTVNYNTVFAYDWRWNETTNTETEISLNTGGSPNNYCLFKNTENGISYTTTTTKFTILKNTLTYGNYWIVGGPYASTYCDMTFLEYVDWKESYFSNFYTGINFNINAVTTPEQQTLGYGMVFIDNNKVTGDKSIPNLLGASVGKTTTGLIPVVAVVGGIILAFIGIRFIVSLFNETKRNKTK